MAYRPEPRPTIQITNLQRGGGWAAVVRACVVLVAWSTLPAGLAAALWLSTFVEAVPSTPDITRSPSGFATEMFATDGTRLGGLLRGRRPHVTYPEMPAKVKVAFLAAEDDAFFEHEGFDLVAIARAALRNRAAGRVVEGGSTITQQLAKDHITRSKTYERKIAELLLARRIEATFSKADILEAYLNEVYLGAGAYGVAAASEIYFDKHLVELTWPEAALIAGMTHSPSQINPFRVPDKALARRNQILERLGAVGMLSDDEVAAYKTAPLGLRTDWSGDTDTAPYAVVGVRQALIEEQGEEAVADGGYEVTLSISPALQDHARRSLSKGLRALDRRQGYRGPLATVEPDRWGDLVVAAAEVYDVSLDHPETWEPEPDRPYVALVESVQPHQLTVNLGGRKLTIGRDGFFWAAPWDPDSKHNEQVLEDATTAFAPGDVVLVAHGTITVWDRPPHQRGRHDEPRSVTGWRIDQVPRVEGVVATADLDTGYVRALQGGWDFDRSEYDRVTAGCRQPGSVFKPIVYSRALEEGMTPATVLTDTPTKIEKSGGEVWAPKNADRDFQGYLLFRDALARSRNLPSLEVFNYVGAHAVVDQAYKLGITTRMRPTEALSLGASCVKPWDMLKVYGTFARRGFRFEPTVLVTVINRDGEVIEDRGAFADAAAPTLARLDRMIDHAFERPERALSDEVAYQMLHLLRAVVYAGTAYAASALGIPVAGKTGTTNAYDAWFVGFSASVVSAVWVGADGNDRPLGAQETGGRIALPVWMDLMRVALDGRRQGGLIGEQPDGIEIKRIDREFGLLSQQGEPGVDLPFQVGTAPAQEAPDRTFKGASKVDRESINF